MPDASVVTAALSATGSVPDAARVALADETVHAPHLMDIEVVSALRALVSRRQLSRERAEAAWNELGHLAVTRYGHAAFLGRIWSLRASISPYDACYVALAEALDAPLLTADARLAQAPGLACEVRLLS